MSNDYPLFFELGGVSVPIQANVEFSQDYEVLSASTLVRMMSGAAVKQTAWSGKLKTTLSGSGWMPVGLDGLDYSSPMVLKCAAARVVGSASNAIAIPSARRVDLGFESYGYAVVRGERVDSPVVLVGDVATVAVVASASHYGVAYYPQLTVYASAPDDSSDLSGADFSWSLEAEEI